MTFTLLGFWLGLVVGFLFGYRYRNKEILILKSEVNTLQYHIRYKNEALQRMMQQIADMSVKWKGAGK